MHVAIITADSTSWTEFEPPVDGQLRQIGKDVGLDVVVPLGSISKVVTTSTLIRLASGGALSLDEAIPAVRPYREQPPPTFRDLLANSGGISPLPRFGSATHAFAPPGAQWCYSELSYTLAAAHAAHLVGRPFAGLVSESMAIATRDQRLITGYETLGAWRVRMPRLRPLARGSGWAAHGMTATALELTRMVRRMLGNSSGAAEMIRAYRHASAPNPFQALGLRITYVNGGSWAWHGGQWLGHHIILAVGATAGIVVFSNVRYRRPVLRVALKQLLSRLPQHALPAPSVWPDLPDRPSISVEMRFVPVGHPMLWGTAWPTLGKAVSLCLADDGSLFIRTRQKSHHLSPTGIDGLWSYRIGSELRHVCLSRTDRVWRLVFEHPCCVLVAPHS